MLRINTVALLKEVHLALRDAEATDDRVLLGAAESVLSALVVVIRREEASVPNELAPYIGVLVKRRKR